MRMKLLLAASATVFVSVVVGAVVSQVMTPDTVALKAAASLPAPSVTVEFIATEIATPRPVVDAQTVQQREATYPQMPPMHQHPPSQLMRCPYCASSCNQLLRRWWRHHAQASQATQLLPLAVVVGQPVDRNNAKISRVTIR
jgi:hypothetical protein